MKNINDRDVILVSACLLGAKVRYDGEKKKNKRIDELLQYYDIIPICPEMDGGLPCPRKPCEIIKDKIVTEDGEDCTAQYQLGANNALTIAKRKKVKFAILKENSPSCGTHKIHDGTFTKNLINGMGLTAKTLHENGIKVYSENEIDELIAQLKK